MRRMMTVVGVIGLFALLAGLCSLLALFVTAIDAWRERAQGGWPQATATIESCNIDLKYYNGPNDDDPTWWLECKIHFGSGSNDVNTRIFSGHRSNPSQGHPEVMSKWVTDHPVGSTIVVRYDPAHLNAIPVSDYLPNGEPRTAGDLRLLAVFIAACASLFALAVGLRRIFAA